MTDEIENESGKEGGGKRGNIADYLQMPRKKRKNYIIMAFREGFDEDLIATIGNFCRTTYQHFAVSQPTTLAELKRQFNRNITILMIDDELGEIPEVIEAVNELKVKRRADKIPVIFFTRNPSSLINAYHEKLLAFHEVDEYFNYPKMQKHEMLGKIKLGVEQQNRRKSRRYNVNLPVNFFHLNSGQSLPGKFVDLSVHGARLKVNKEFVFREGDQIKLSIPVSNFMKHDEGDYMRISARVRRVMMSGNTAAISFEHMSEHQFLRLTMLVTGIVNQQMMLQNKAAKKAASE